MTPSSENPYQSPRADLPATKIPGWSLLRGLKWAVLLGVCGFCLPGALHVMSASWEPGEHSAVAFALLFASAAFARFTPRRGVGFLYSLLVVGVLLIGTLSAVSVFEMLLGIGGRGARTTWCGLYSWLHLAAFVGIYLPAVGGFTVWQIRHSRSVSSKTPAGCCPERIEQE